MIKQQKKATKQRSLSIVSQKNRKRAEKHRRRKKNKKKRDSCFQPLSLSIYRRSSRTAAAELFKLIIICLCFVWQQNSSAALIIIKVPSRSVLGVLCSPDQQHKLYQSLSGRQNERQKKASRERFCKRHQKLEKLESACLSVCLRVNKAGMQMSSSSKLKLTRVHPHLTS